eukprot:COSAG01_NODE_808_length_13418_cov_9.469631_12_plen_181_part_00
MGGGAAGSLCGMGGTAAQSHHRLIEQRVGRRRDAGHCLRSSCTETLGLRAHPPACRGVWSVLSSTFWATTRAMETAQSTVNSQQSTVNAAAANDTVCEGEESAARTAESSAPWMSKWASRRPRPPTHRGRLHHRRREGPRRGLAVGDRGGGGTTQAAEEQQPRLSPPPAGSAPAAGGTDS